uniref:Wall-associated receptor kinase galacturonan-binding domain-containing protein n=1 Tax=Setaria italica TaxID=4555 RepID=K3XPZ1_SETIT
MPPLLLLLLASFLLPPPAASAGTAQPSSCWPKTCGGLNITYPFWLEERDRPPCGPPAFQLKCNSSGAFMVKSVYQAYRVVSIFAENQSLHVVDINLPLDTGCPAPTFNVSLVPRPLAFSKANKELLFLSKCTAGSQPEDSTGFHSLPCDRSAFVRLGDGRNFSRSHIQGGIPPGCFFAFVPILEVPNGNGDEYVVSLKKGFLLEWTTVPGHCPDCMESGGECVYSDTGLNFACKCSGTLLPEKCAAAAVAVASARPNVQGGDCSASIRCGNLTISKPFRIVPDQATEGSCGLLGFQVVCENHTPYL